jgi:hypothetical protein
MFLVLLPHLIFNPAAYRSKNKVLGAIDLARIQRLHEQISVKHEILGRQRNVLEVVREVL